LVAMDLFSLSILHGICNALLLQLNECIESTQNEVKRKMSVSVAHRSAPKSPARVAQEKMLAGNSERRHPRPRAGNLARSENQSQKAPTLTIASRMESRAARRNL
jgi:hypothetical protein